MTISLHPGQTNADGSELRCRPSSPSPVIVYEKGTIEDSNEKSSEPTPLPKLQVSILLLMLLSEPCTAGVLLPFINNLVYETGITHGSKAKIGYYAGLVESLFFITESVCILQYGRLSDRIGRRPVLFFGLSGLAISTLCFGISKSFAGVIISRALAGVLNGNAGVIKSVLGEVTDDTNAAQAFAFIPMVWAIGFTLAPAVGGLLQHPAETMPRIFGWSSTLKEYPYLLPCIVVALVPASGLVLGWFFLRETHPVLGRQGYRLVGTASSSPAGPGSPDQAEFLGSETVTSPPLSSLLTRRVCKTILNYALVSLLDISMVALPPLVFASPVAVGGLGLQPATIGLVLALQGIVTGAATALLVPRMQRWFGMRATYRWGVWLYLGQIWLLPTMHYAVKTNLADGLGLWVLVALYAVISCASPITFCCLLLFISAAPPNPLCLGATNGLAQTSASIMRAIGPAITTSLFALSANSGSSLVYVVLSIETALCIGAAMESERAKSTHSSRSSSLNRNEPSRRSSTWSTSLDPSTGATSAGQPSLFRILNAAAQYSQLIVHEDSSESESGSVETPASASAADAQGVTGDDNLQQGAYPFPETTLANLALHPHVRSRSDSVTSLQRLARYTTGMVPEITPGDILGIKEGMKKAAEEPLQYDPSKISDHSLALKVLQHEFGELTLPGEVEEMILETDAALFRDVTILGVIHLTTHRVAFHASLLPNADEDTYTGSTLSHGSRHNADSQILKAGPGVVIEPRTGILHPQKKRRVWIELSHDMVTTYPDASDEGRVRPIRSILLANLKDIDPYDPTRPTRVGLHLSALGLELSRDVEFDTEESAHEWRREISAALYLYRHHRKTLIGHGNEKIAPRPEDAQTESRGVRICIPLALIKEYQHEWWAAWAFILSVAVDHHTSGSGVRDIIPSGSLGSAVKSVLGAVAPLESDIQQPAQSAMPNPKKRESFTTLSSLPNSQAPSLSPVTSISTDGSSVRESSASSQVPPSPNSSLQTNPLGSESEALAQVLHLSVLQGDERWNKFDDLVKTRRESGAPPNAQVVLDWGELVFDEHTESEAGSHTTREMKVEAPAPNEMSSAERKIRRLFAIDNQEKVWIARCRICKTISSTTYFVISDRFICYWAKSFRNHDTRYRFPVSSVRGAATAYVYAPLVYGLRLQIRGQNDLTFEFNSRELRDGALTKLKAIADANLASEGGPTITTGSEVSSPRAERPSPITIPEFSSTQECVSNAPALFSPLSRTMQRVTSVHVPPALVSRFPKPINLPPSTLVHIPPKHFVCLTIGSRGDVQPYIALARGLMAEGHRVTIVTHEEYKEWCEGWGVAHRTAGGDPGALMKLSVETRMFSPQFFKEGLTNFRDWLDDLLVDSWKQCQDADVLIQSPSAMAGAHIAEALKIPFFHAFTMPWTRTNDYPHAFMTPPVEIPGSFNYSTYVVFDNVFWQATSGQINRWRRKHLGLPNTDMAHLAQTKIPFIYNFSPAVVPKPLDWKDPITISGYWFLDDADLNWKASQELTDFMNKAREDKKPLVYIGFGSIVVPNPKAMTRSIVKAVLKSDVRAILSKGWSARMSKETGPEVELPPEIFSVDKIPHDWLFPKVDAALHHGGAGTTGASLRAGIPTLIKPWFGDQFFWATRVMKLGAGLRVSSLSSSDLSDALKRAVSDRVMKEKAAAVGEKIRSENGVANAIRAIYTYLPRAAQDRTTL